MLLFHWELFISQSSVIFMGRPFARCWIFLFLVEALNRSFDQLSQAWKQTPVATNILYSRLYNDHENCMRTSTPHTHTHTHPLANKHIGTSRWQQEARKHSHRLQLTLWEAKPDTRWDEVAFLIICRACLCLTCRMEVGPGHGLRTRAGRAKRASAETYKVPTTIYWEGSNCGVQWPQRSRAVSTILICFTPFDTASRLGS